MVENHLRILNRKATRICFILAGISLGAVIRIVWRGPGAREVGKVI